MTALEPKERTVVRGPSTRLVVGLLVTLGLILAFCLYTAREIGLLRDEQTHISERNRLDSLQLLRIQNNLSTMATAMRDMADRTEPYPMVSWRQTFDRIKARSRAGDPVGTVAGARRASSGAAGAARGVPCALLGARRCRFHRGRGR